MKKIVVGLIVALSCISASACKWVDPYTRADGTRVSGYWNNQGAACQTGPNWKIIAKVGMVILVIKGITYLIDKSKEQQQKQVLVEPQWVIPQEAVAQKPSHFLVTVEWADGEQDTFSVRADTMEKAKDRVFRKFINSTTEASFIRPAQGMIDVSTIVEFN